MATDEKEMTPGKASYLAFYGNDESFPYEDLSGPQMDLWEQIAKAAIDNEHKAGCPGCPCR